MIEYAAEQPELFIRSLADNVTIAVPHLGHVASLVARGEQLDLEILQFLPRPLDGYQVRTGIVLRVPFASLASGLLIAHGIEPLRPVLGNLPVLSHIVEDRNLVATQEVSR
jgi:hypothetical protein